MKPRLLLRKVIIAVLAAALMVSAWAGYEHAVAGSGYRWTTSEELTAAQESIDGENSLLRLDNGNVGTASFSAVTQFFRA